VCACCPTLIPANIPQFTISSAKGRFAFTQVLPFSEPMHDDPAEGHPKDHAFRLALRVNAQMDTWFPQTSYGMPRPVDPLEHALISAPGFVACVQLDEWLTVDVKVQPLSVPPAPEWMNAAARNLSAWESYWSKSGVALDDTLLERVWYWNLYFLNCAVKPEATCPGLFANWSYLDIGTAWHGDYHMNYNTQQPFWVTFSSNHVDKHLAYVNLVEHLLPISRKWAREYYGLRSAYFPHSAYPTEMNIMPYPVPHWGWEVCETPWTVQSLWWHYRYTMDLDFLRARLSAYERSCAIPG
jgi:alpha-L-fucosidase 2